MIPERPIDPPENRKLDKYVDSDRYKTDLAIAVDEWKEDPDNAKTLETIIYDYVPDFAATAIMDGEHFQEDLREMVDGYIAREYVASKVQKDFLTAPEPMPDEYWHSHNKGDFE